MLASGASALADPAARPPLAGEARPDYASLLQRLKGGDLDVNFKVLRAAYARSPDYHPYGGDAAARHEMVTAYKAGDCDKALAAAGQVLKSDYLDLDAHFISGRCDARLGHAHKAAFHQAVFTGLLKPILASGDGKTLQTAYVVLSVPEEYTVIGYLGRRPTRQSVVRVAGRLYDRMDVTDLKSGAPSVVYFDVDQPFGWLQRRLSQGAAQ